jgi:hypothetical protein
MKPPPSQEELGFYFHLNFYMFVIIIDLEGRQADSAPAATKQ